MTFRNRLLSMSATLILVATSLLAQGQSGTLTGTITQSGNPLPGVNVTVSSPNLQGIRTTVTNDAGGYNFPGLPPGEYTVKMELEGLHTAVQRTRVGVAQTARVDGDMRVSAVAEAITVTATAPAVAETTEVQVNFTQKEVDDLPIGRTIAAITTLSPGVTANGPANAIVMSGGQSFDNVFLVDGVNIQENLRGQTHTLFIEDAIQETTVQTAGISAEYGNFTGGVVNAITKSGGNTFSGSFRDSVTNDAWTSTSSDIYVLQSGAATRTPATDNLDKNNYVYEATLGGRIIRDRLWFFAAARYDNRTFTNTFSNQTRIFERGDKDERKEIKLTGAISPKHSLVGSYLEAPRTRTNDCQLGCIDMSSVDSSNSLPLEYTNVFYNGILTSNFLIEAKWADKNFSFQGTGGETPDLINGSPIRFVAPGWATVGNEPYFGGSGRHSDERNSDQIAAKATYFLGTQSMGTHNLVIGAERWTEARKSNNFQSPTDFVIYAQGRAPVVDANGGVTMSFVSGTDWILHYPIALQSLGSDLNTDGFYLNDKWDMNNRWTFNLGVRYDANQSKDSTGNRVSDDSKISPRLGAMYDVFANGRLRLNASYGHYVGRLADTIAGSGSAAGSPATIIYLYGGPTIENATMESASRQIFEWFNANGGTTRTPLSVSIPGFNTKLADTLVSPNVQEWTVGASTQIGSNGYIRGDIISRTWADFYGINASRTLGRVTSPSGQSGDLRLVDNTDDFERDYRALQLQAGYRPLSRLNLGANYTYAELKGNLVGETSGSGPVTEATRNFYPEYFDFSWNNPTGFLPQDQTHKLRVFAAVDIPTFLGNFNVSVLERFDSGTSYSLSGSINPSFNANFYGTGLPGGVVNPGYASAQTSATYFFGERGGERFDDLTSTDVALNYSTNPGWFGGLQLFAQGEVINAFNEDANIAFNTGILTHLNDASLKRFNPMAGDVPVEGVHWKKGPLFGLPTNAATPASTTAHFQLPRTYRVSFGVRF